MHVRSLHTTDYEQWLSLYHLYADHYQMTLTDDGLRTTWHWLMDDDHALTGIVAEVDGVLVGLAHYRAMPSPLRGQNMGFLDDLIVSPAHRGNRVATHLLEQLKQIATQKMWHSIRWITKEDNDRARALYDKVATKTDWVLYEMAIPK